MDKSLQQTDMAYRSDIEELYDFTIDSSLIKEISTHESVSYTFLITREEKDSTYFENLVLEVFDNDDVKAYIIKYTKNAEPEYIEDHKSYFIDADMELTHIFFDDSDAERITYECNQILVTYCNNGQNGGEGQTHVAGERCENEDAMWQEAEVVCNLVESGSGGSSDEETGTGGTTEDPETSTGGPSEEEPDDIKTVTVVEDEVYDAAHQENCQELNKFTTSNYSQDEFNNLESEINAGREKGYLIKANPSFPYFSSEFVESSNNCSQIKMPRNNALIFSIMHTHPTGCDNGIHPMFGHGDLHNLYLLSQNYNTNIVPELGSDPSLLTVYMTVANYHYAIKINDINKLQTLGAIFGNVDDKVDFEKDLKSAFENASDDTASTQQELAVAFLKFLKDKDLGVSLYRTAHDNLDFDPSMPPGERDAQWQQLILNNQNTSYITKDCN